MVKNIGINSCNIFSASTWITGKILSLKGYYVAGIIFEIVSKISGRKQHIPIYKEYHDG